MRFVVVGELHGSNEAPRLFTDLVCEAARARRPVLVALERDTSEQPALDEFLASDGSVAARQALITAAGWKTQDGRSSEARLTMIDSLRQLTAARGILGVLAFREISRPLEPGEDVNYAVNRAMANALQAAEPKNALVLVFTGNSHAYRRTVESGEGAFQPAAALLPPGETKSLTIEADGGAAWNCNAVGCGPHPVAGQPPHRFGLVLDRTLEEGFDGVIYLGRAATPSPPVKSPRD